MSEKLNWAIVPYDEPGPDGYSPATKRILETCEVGDIVIVNKKRMKVTKVERGEYTSTVSMVMYFDEDEKSIRSLTKREDSE